MRAAPLSVLSSFCQFAATTGLLLGVGCVSASDSGNSDGPPPALPDLQTASACSAAIQQDERPGANWSCTAPESCTADYLAYPALATAWAKPITDMQLQQEFTDILLGKVMLQPGPLSADQLRSTIIDLTNVGALVAGLDTRPLHVSVIGRSMTADYEERDLLISDPYVGTTRAVYLLPRTPGPHPAVVAIHGHGDSAEIYRDKYHGGEYPAHGYAILMITMRAFNIDKDENNVWHTLVLDGLSLIGLRVYEALLGRKYLSCQPEILADHIGLIGHSGGSSTGNLAVRIEPRFRAYVSDLQVNWYHKELWEVYHCENHPVLYPYNKLINDFQTSATPVKTVPYGYTNGVAEIFDFFDKTLKP